MVLLRNQLFVVLSLVSCTYATLPKEQPRFLPIFVNETGFPTTLNVKTKSGVIPFTAVPTTRFDRISRDMYKGPNWISLGRLGSNNSPYFDCALQTWATTTHDVVPTGSMTGITSKGHLIVAGGYQHGQQLSTVTWYASPAKKDMPGIVLPPLHQAREYGTLGLLKRNDSREVMFIAGGYTPDGYTDTCEWLLMPEDETNIEGYGDWQACDPLPYPAETWTDTLVWQNNVVSVLYDEGRTEIWTYAGPWASPNAGWVQLMTGLPEDSVYPVSTLYLKNLDQLCVAVDTSSDENQKEYCIDSLLGAWTATGMEYGSEPIGSLSQEDLAECFSLTVEDVSLDNSSD